MPTKLDEVVQKYFAGVGGGYPAILLGKAGEGRTVVVLQTRGGKRGGCDKSFEIKKRGRNHLRNVG